MRDEWATYLIATCTFASMLLLILLHSRADWLAWATDIPSPGNKQLLSVRLHMRGDEPLDN